MKLSFWKISIISFISIIIIILLIAPSIIKNQIEKNSKEWFVRKVKISSISINYFTATVSIEDFKYYEANDSDIFVSFDKLLINSDLIDFFSNRLKIEDLILSGLTVNTELEDSTFNFDDISEFYATRDTTGNIVIEDSLDDSEPFIIDISNIRFNAKLISFDDRNVDQITELNDLNINIPQITIGDSSNSVSDIFFWLNKETSISANIDYNADNNDLKTIIEVSNFNLASYLPYIKNELNINSFEGIINTKVYIDGNLDTIDKLIVKGNILVSDFEIKDSNDKKLVGLQKLKVDVSKIDFYNNTYSIDSVNIYQPYIAIELHANDKTNFDYILKEKDNDDASNVDSLTADTVSEQNELQYAIKSVKIENGNIDFSDFTTPSVFNYKLSKIELNTKDIASSADWVNTKLSMLMNDRGNMLVDFGFNPNKPMDMDIDYSMKNFALKDINIYSVQETSYPFVKGDMYYISKTNIRGGVISSNNKLQIKDTRIGDKVSGVKGVPLKLALYIITDKNGDINIDLPINGDVNDPDYSISKLVWAAIKNVIIKIASSPYDLIAGDAGVDPENIKAIKFEYLDSNLNSRVFSQIKDLHTIEKIKPGLAITLNYYNDSKVEKELIAIEQVKTLKSTLANNDREIKNMSLEEFLSYKSLNDSLDIAERCMLIIGKRQVDSIYTAYDKVRINKLYTEINNNLKSEIKINGLTESKDNLGKKPTFEIRYNIRE